MLKVRPIQRLQAVMLPPNLSLCRSHLVLGRGDMQLSGTIMNDALPVLI